MKTTTAAVLFLLSAVSFSRELGLQEAIDTALKNGKLIRAAEISKENAGLNVAAAFKKALPSVAYEGVYQKSEIPRYIDRDNYILPDGKKGYQQSIGIYQPIFQGGAIIAGVKGAKAYRSIEDLLYLAEKRDVRLETIITYSNIVMLQNNLTVFESSKKELLSRYEKQKSQMGMRMVTKADLLKTEYSLLDIAAAMTTVKNQIEIEKKDLKVRLGIPEDEEIEVMDFKVPEDFTEDVDYKKDLKNALADSLSSRIAENKVKVREAENIVTRAELLPKVKAFAVYETGEKRSISDTVNDANWAGGVAVSWNAFQFGKDVDRYKASKNEVRIEELKKSNTKDSIEIDVTRKYLELVRMEDVRKTRKKALEAAQENFAIDNERYNAGMISTIDYLASETQVRQAAVDYNEVIINCYIAFEKYRSVLI